MAMIPSIATRHVELVGPWVELQPAAIHHSFGPVSVRLVDLIHAVNYNRF